MLTAKTLKGVWALVATPWTDDDHLDDQALHDDVTYLCGAGLDGLYTTASSGEFFAVDDGEFRRLVRIVLDAAKPTNTPVQVCCAASDTRGFLRRASFAVEAGCAAVQVILPCYIALTKAEALDFFRDAARVCGRTPLMHYNTANAKLTFEAEDYRRVVEEVPTLIGTKQPRGQPLWFANLCRQTPELSHFTAEYTYAADMAGGARGVYSWLAVTNPRLALHWHRACEGGDWNEAVRVQGLVNRFKNEVKQCWAGQSDAAVNKADAALNPNIRCGLRVRAPYRSCTREDVDTARRWAEQHFPELLIW